MIQMMCPECRAALAVDDVPAGSELTCPDCSVKLRVPTPEPEPQITEHRPQNFIRVRLMAAGMAHLFDAAFPIRVDGRLVAKGSHKKGFDFVITLRPGLHKVEIAGATHPLEFPEPGRYEVEFEYSRTWGNYSRPPSVQFLGDGEWTGWTAPLHEDQPIRLELQPDGVSRKHDDVLAEFEQQQNKKASWGAAIGILGVSLLLFMAAAGAQKLFDNLLMIIVVLAFHEAGHYVAMRIFGYRNVRMFFIPFFGAAASGQHYNVAGWKKAVVALAGPVPGILFAVPIGVAGTATERPQLLNAAMFMLFLNGYNLLPMLPLDGGWVLHAVLFVRHPVLDVVFRVVACVLMFVMAIVFSQWCLCAVAIFMLVLTPTAYRVARVAHRLRQAGIRAGSPDAITIPHAAAQQILAELWREMPANTPPNVLAQDVANVFEMFNAEPPGVLASLALLTLYAGSFISALMSSVIFAGFQAPPAG